MPIYEYTCDACGHHFEYLARTLSDKPEQCPTCGEARLTKAFSTFQASTRTSTPAGCPATCAHAHGPGCGCCGCH